VKRVVAAKSVTERAAEARQSERIHSAAKRAAGGEDL
jgi:hypothetical protein